MLTIKLNSEPRQKHQISIPELGTTFDLSLYFTSQQRGWFIMYLDYAGYIIRNIRICNSIQLLSQYSRIIPFGLACISIEDREPSFLEDFVEKKSALLLLTKSEITDYQNYLNGD